MATDQFTLTGPSDAREKLRQHFKDVPSTEHGGRWDKLWEKGDLLPWDRGLPNPALVDTMNDRQDLLGRPVVGEGSNERRKRALVPGCGKGYDVLLLASCGYDAYGLEVSENAVKACERFANEHFDGYKAKSAQYGCGEYKFVLGDFFKDDWINALDIGDTGFDLVYDYTVSPEFPFPHVVRACLI